MKNKNNTTPSEQIQNAMQKW